jgi:acetyltransferase
MFSSKDAVELILGIKKDKIFGTVLMVGMGGITAELFGDKALGFPPLERKPGPENAGIAEDLSPY